MELWMVLSSLCVLYGLLQHLAPKKYVNICTMVFLFSITLFAGFRYMIGWDYQSYVDFYSTIQLDDLYPEYSFRLLVVCLRNIGVDFQGIFIVYSGLTSFFVWQGIKYYINDKYARNVALVLFVLITDLYWNFFSIIRQGLAVAIVFWGFRYVIKKSFGRYLLVIIFASFIHLSAMFFLPVYILSKKPQMQKSTHILTIITAILMCKLDLIIPLMMWLLEKTELYTLQYLDVQTTFTSIGLGVVFQGLIWLGITLFRKYPEENKNEILYTIYTLSYFFYYLFYFFPPISRISVYLKIVHILIIPIFLKDFTTSIRYSLLTLFLVGYALVLLHNVAVIPGFLEGQLHPYISATNINYEFNFNIFK